MHQNPTTAAIEAAYNEARDAADLRHSEAVDAAYRDLRGAARREALEEAAAQISKDYWAAQEAANAAYDAAVNPTALVTAIANMATRYGESRSAAEREARFGGDLAQVRRHDRAALRRHAALRRLTYALAAVPGGAR